MGNSYASFTSHIISDWTYKSYLIACTHLTKHHTGNALASFLVETAQRFGILEKLTFVSVDNASNAKASVRLAAEDYAILREICEEDVQGFLHVEETERVLDGLSLSDDALISPDAMEDIEAFIELD